MSGAVIDNKAHILSLGQAQLHKEKQLILFWQFEYAIMMLGHSRGLNGNIIFNYWIIRLVEGLDYVDG